MTTTTFCTANDVAAILSDDLSERAIDDGEDGSVSTAEEAYRTRAIEQGANDIALYIHQRYAVASNASNPWLRDCNAVLAAFNIARRRQMSVSEMLRQERKEYLDKLIAIRDGKLQLPGGTPRASGAPVVTNYRIDATDSLGPIKVDPQRSSGALNKNTKRYLAGGPP